MINMFTICDIDFLLIFSYSCYLEDKTYKIFYTLLFTETILNHLIVRYFFLFRLEINITGYEYNYHCWPADSRMLP